MVLKVLFLLRATAAAALNTFSFPRTSLHKEASFMQDKRRAQSYSAKCGLEPPDVLRLAETARISLTPNQVEDFAPKIQQVVDWFGQLQAVDLQSIEPAIRADTEYDNLRDDLPETFQNREAMIAAVPNYDEPFIKVPPVLNKE